MTRLYALWCATAMQVRFTLVTPVAVVVGVIQPIAFVSVALTGRTEQSAGSSGQVIVGGALLALWSGTLWAAGSVLRRENYAGTLSAIVCRPTPLLLVLAGKALGAALACSAMVAVSTTATALLLHAHPTFGAPVLLVPVIVLALLSSTLLGVCVSCLTMFTRAGARVIEALMYPVFVFGGLIIPLTELPRVLRYPSTVLSFRWAVELATGAATHVLAALALMTGLTLAYGVAAVGCTSLALERARREATFDRR